MLQRVLLVDDSDGEALFVKRTLREAGFDDPIYHIRDSEEALAYFNGDGLYANRDKYPLPEILLLDLGMPRIDGYQLLRWIRNQLHLASMYVVVLTGETDPRRVALAYQLGANSYLSKSGTIEEYRNFVEFFRGYGRIANAMPRLADPSLTSLPLRPVETPPNTSSQTGADGASGRAT